MLLEHLKQRGEIQTSQRMSRKDCVKGIADAEFITVGPNIGLDADTPRCEGRVQRDLAPVVIVRVIWLRYHVVSEPV